MNFDLGKGPFNAVANVIDALFRLVEQKQITPDGFGFVLDRLFGRACVDKDGISGEFTYRGIKVKLGGNKEGE